MIHFKISDQRLCFSKSKMYLLIENTLIKTYVKLDLVSTRTNLNCLFIFCFLIDIEMLNLEKSSNYEI